MNSAIELCETSRPPARPPSPQCPEGGDDHGGGKRVGRKVGHLAHKHGEEARPPQGLEEVAVAAGTRPRADAARQAQPPFFYDEAGANEQA